MGDIREKLKRLKEIRCECIDEVTPSPEVRAKKILNYLLEKDDGLDNWDGICFSIIYLSSQLATLPDFAQDIKSISLKLMQNHYFSEGGLGQYDESAINKLTKLRYEQRASATKTGDDS